MKLIIKKIFCNKLGKINIDVKSLVEIDYTYVWYHFIALYQMYKIIIKKINAYQKL